MLYVKDLIEDDYVGEVLSCQVTTMRGGAVERSSSDSWQRDVSQGANTLTIANGHVIDALRFVAGDFTRVACMVSGQMEGTLFVTGSVSSQRGEMLRIRRARKSNELQDLNIPDRFAHVPSE